MQTSNGHPIDLNDPGQRGNAAPEQSPPDVYADQMARLTSPAINAAHAAKFAAARERATRLRFRLRFLIGVRSSAGFPCPEPSAISDTDAGYRTGFDYGFRLNGDWYGFTGWGAAYAAGCDMGRFWRLDDHRPILAVAG